jgi:hypothetical protein
MRHEDDTIKIGMSNSYNFMQDMKATSINSYDNKNKKSKFGMLSNIMTKEERQVFLDKERAELPEELRFDIYQIPIAIVREIRKLNEEKQPRGFWANYARLHGLAFNSVARIRDNKGRKDVI